MKERPMLFSAPMVRAILDGRKTVTRRIVKARDLEWMDVHQGLREPDKAERCPYGQPGDRLWVRETWQFYDWTDDGQPCVRFAADNASKWPLRIPEEQADRLTEIWAGLSAPENYSIDNHARDRRWRPSIHMPRWASRITLEVTSVRVERLQDISEADALAEGVTDDGSLVTDLAGNDRGGAFAAFAALWEVINGADSWDDNPWVWVVEFRRLT